MGPQVTRRAEFLVADIAFMGLLSRMYQVVFLQVGKLCEAFTTRWTFERSLAGVRS